MTFFLRLCSSEFLPATISLLIPHCYFSRFTAKRRSENVLLAVESMIRNMMAIPVIISQSIKFFLFVFLERLLDVHIVNVFVYIGKSSEICALLTFDEKSISILLIRPVKQVLNEIATACRM